MIAAQTGQTVQISNNIWPAISYTPGWRSSGFCLDPRAVYAGSYSHGLCVFPYQSGDDGPVVGWPDIGGHATFAGTDRWWMKNRNIAIIHDGADGQPVFEGAGKGFNYQPNANGPKLPTTWHAEDAQDLYRIGGQFLTWQYGASPVDGAHNYFNRVATFDRNGNWVDTGQTLERFSRVVPFMVKVHDTLGYYMGGDQTFFRIQKLDFEASDWYVELNPVYTDKAVPPADSPVTTRIQGIYSAALDRILLTNGNATKWVAITLDGRAESFSLVHQFPSRHGKLLRDIKTDRTFWDIGERLWEVDFKTGGITELPPPGIVRWGRSGGDNQGSALWRDEADRLWLISISHQGQAAPGPVMGYLIDDGAPQPVIDHYRIVGFEIVP